MSDIGVMRRSRQVGLDSARGISRYNLTCNAVRLRSDAGIQGAFVKPGGPLRSEILSSVCQDYHWIEVIFFFA
jgi:hypothetical protein